MCMHTLKYFTLKLRSNLLPRWTEMPERRTKGTKEEKCYEKENNSTNFVMDETKLDCYEKINDTTHILETLHLWLDGGLVPFTGKITYYLNSYSNFTIIIIIISVNIDDGYLY